MIAVFIAEYREWKMNLGRKSIFLITVLTGGSLLISQMLYSFLFTIPLIFFIWLGWSSGTHRWNELKAW